MSYNISRIKTIESNLEISCKFVKELLESEKLPEHCFLYDLKTDDIADNDIFKLNKISWIYTASGSTFDFLKEILMDYCTGAGQFVVIWEDGAQTGLRVDGEGKNRRITEPNVKISLE